jgi:hypothetical protein
MARHNQTISCAIGTPKPVAVQGLDEGLTLSCQIFLRNYIKFATGKNGQTLHHEPMGLGRTSRRVRPRLPYHTETGINTRRILGFPYRRTLIPKTSTAHFYERRTTNMGPCPATSTLDIPTQI